MPFMVSCLLLRITCYVIVSCAQSPKPLATAGRVRSATEREKDLRQVYHTNTQLLIYTIGH